MCFSFRIQLLRFTIVILLVIFVYVSPPIYIKLFDIITELYKISSKYFRYRYKRYKIMAFKYLNLNSINI